MAQFTQAGKSDVLRREVEHERRPAPGSVIPVIALVERQELLGRTEDRHAQGSTGAHSYVADDDLLGRAVSVARRGEPR
jgi:hypothetical protein